MKWKKNGRKKYVFETLIFRYKLLFSSGFEIAMRDGC